MLLKGTLVRPSAAEGTNGTIPRIADLFLLRRGLPQILADQDPGPLRADRDPVSSSSWLGAYTVAVAVNEIRN